LIVMAGLIALGAIGWLGPLVPLEWIVTAGVACSVLGIVLGVPTGFWYHVRLYAALRRQGPLPALWWLRPHSLHGQLAEAERPEVLRWFYLGGAGFALTATGCALVMLAVVIANGRLR
jgi:hypothetical protein